MRIHYRIYNEVRADGGVSWYADKWEPADWSCCPTWELFRLVFPVFGWESLATWTDGDPKPVGKNEQEARKACEDDAAEINKTRAAVRAAKIVAKSNPILVSHDVE